MTLQRSGRLEGAFTLVRAVVIPINFVGRLLSLVLYHFFEVGISSGASSVFEMGKSIKLPPPLSHTVTVT